MALKEPTLPENQQWRRMRLFNEFSLSSRRQKHHRVRDRITYITRDKPEEKEKNTHARA